MREKPRISDEDLVERVSAAYGLRVRDATFLAAGADADAAAYRISTDEGPLFLKLRRGRSPAPEVSTFLAGSGPIRCCDSRPFCSGDCSC